MPRKKVLRAGARNIPRKKVLRAGTRNVKMGTISGKRVVEKINNVSAAQLAKMPKMKSKLATSTRKNKSPASQILSAYGLKKGSRKLTPRERAFLNRI